VEHTGKQWAAVTKKGAVKFYKRQPKQPAGGFVFEVSEEMTTAVAVAFDLVEQIFKKYGSENVDLEIEKKVKVTKEIFGTVDILLIPLEVKKLIVIDYKHGAGKDVDAVDNWQLMAYAVGALNRHAEWDVCESVTVAIVQPRTPGKAVKTAVYTIEEVKAWREKIKNVELASGNPAAPLVTGDHCHWCPAHAVCPQVKNELLELLPDGAPDKSALTADQVAAILPRLPELKKWIDAVEKWTANEIQSGRNVGGWKLVQGRGRRVWKDYVDAAALVEVFDDHRAEDFQKIELLSPAQAEKLLSKEEKKQLQELIEKRPGRATLASPEDPREPLSFASTDDLN
jgi:CRISPR/Cas system-associated exonuclease Cas4 (RecB family)